MSSLRTWWYAVIGGLVALLCANSASAQGERALSGRVHDASTARPLVGAVVSIVGAETRTTRTDQDGRFAFGNVLPGTYSLSVRSIGYEPYNQNVTPDGNVPLSIAVRRIAALDTVRVRAAAQGIYGSVAAASDLRPLANARVQFFGTSLGEVSTDSGGRFFYAVKSPGSYMVRAKSSGFAAQTASVTIEPGDGVELSMLLDSASSFGANALEMAFADLRDRLGRRGNASAVVPQDELLGNGTRDLVSSLLTARSFATKAMRFKDVACVFVDGMARVGVSPNAFDPASIQTVELYSVTSERSGTLETRWPRGAPCGDTGMPAATEMRGRGMGNRERTSELVHWMVIWLKH